MNDRPPPISILGGNGSRRGARFSLTFLTVAIAAAILPCGSDSFAQSSADESRQSPTKSNPTKLRTRYNILYASDDEQIQRADIYRPDDEKIYPGILLIHGGAWIAGDKLHDSLHAKRIAARGFVVMAINYRLAPKYKHPAQIDDCFKAYEWFLDHAQELGVDSNRMGAWGYSAGGHLASLMATDPRPNTPRLQVCVAGGSPCDLRVIPDQSKLLTGLLGGTKEALPEVYDKASPICHVSSDDPPMFLFHGTSDQLVKEELSQRMSDELQRAGVEVVYVKVDRKSHIMTFADFDVLEESINFLDSKMK